MKLDIPYYTQFDKEIDPKWQNSSCAMVCLKMALDFLVPGRAPSINTLMEEAQIHTASMITAGLLTEKVAAAGLSRDVTVAMVHNYGIPAYREEFKSMTLDEHKQSIPSEYEEDMFNAGVQKIAKELKQMHVPMISFLPGLSEGKSIHAVLFTGFEEEDGNVTGFYFHDPDAKTDPRSHVFISLADFQKYWRKMALFIG